jgi:hypothetical protein
VLPENPGSEIYSAIIQPFIHTRVKMQTHEIQKLNELSSEGSKGAMATSLIALYMANNPTYSHHR